MWTRVLAAFGVGVWCFFVLFASLGIIVDRGLAESPWPWLGVLGIGVVAPAILLRQANRAIVLHEERRLAASGPGDKERELLEAVRDRGEITPATAAMRTSLTVDEAAGMLERLAGKGHLQALGHDGGLAYSLFERDRGEGKTLEAAEPANPAPPADTPEPLAEPLSERELEVLHLLVSGRTNREIASDLFVTVGTVKSHVSNIYGKLGARNRAEALRRTRELDLLR